MALEAYPKSVIYQGEDKDLYFSITDQDGKPFNLAQASEIIALFRNADQSVLIKKLSLGQVSPVNAGGGLIRVSILSANSKLLQLGDNQSVEIRIVINTFASFAPALNQLTVLASQFPEVP